MIKYCNFSISFGLPVILAVFVRTSGCGDGDNLAFRKPAYQSTTYANNHLRPLPERGVDGNENMDYYGCNSCFHTAHETSPWWMVDLEENYVIERVEIFNRADTSDTRLRDFSIHISQDYTISDGMINPSLCAGPFASQTAGSTVSYPCTSPILGRYVRVLATNTYLHLCEVKVFGLSVGPGISPKQNVCNNHFSDAGGFYPNSTPIHSRRLRSKTMCAELCSSRTSCTSFSVTKQAVDVVDCRLFDCNQVTTTPQENTTYYIQTRWKLNGA